MLHKTGGLLKKYLTRHRSYIEREWFVELYYCILFNNTNNRFPYTNKKKLLKTIMIMHYISKYLHSNQ